MTAVLVVAVLASPSVAGFSDQLTGRGYVSFLQTVSTPDVSSVWITESSLLNRCEGQWSPALWLRVSGSVRTRLVYGDFIETIPDYKRTLSVSNGSFDLSADWADGTSWVLHSEIDRLYADLSFTSWLFRFGRHRVNWGMNLVWNPNDLFNTYSLFDVEYPERPGTDAVLVEYYPSPTSSVQLVYRVADTPDSMAAAALGRMNVKGYDVQVLGGFVGGDLVAGGGWSGQIAGGGFRGEASYFHSRHDPARASGVLTASVSGDYTFPFDLYLHAAVLYVSNGTVARQRDLPTDPFQSFNLSAKRLSTSRFDIYGQASYQLTPLVRVELQGIVNPADHSFFAGPASCFSLSDNAEVRIVTFIFGGPERTEFGGNGVAAFGSLKWSF